jgi:hypothetical protein
VKIQPSGAAALRKNMAVAASSKVHLTDDSRQRSFENTFRHCFRNTFTRRAPLKCRTLCVPSVYLTAFQKLATNLA